MLPSGMVPASPIRAATISPLSTSAARVSPIPRSISHSGNRIPGRLQQDASLGERQPDDVGIAAVDAAHINFAIALERITPRLAAPLAVAGIMVDFVLREPLHRDQRLDQ